MYYLKTECNFDAAHFLKNYDGKCKNLHGHRWRIVAEIQSEFLLNEPQSDGMLIDFSELKNALESLCGEFDHCLIYETDTLKKETLLAFADENFKVVEVSFRPTAENFARHFFEKLKVMGFFVRRVEVYETEKNRAAYEEK